jgi:hypothetical protein
MEDWCICWSNVLAHLVKVSFDGCHGQRGCCRSDGAESPRKSGMKFWAMAARSVERVGENSAAGAQAKSLGVFVWWLTAKEVCRVAMGVTVMGTVHRRVLWSRLPVSTVMSS